MTCTHVILPLPKIGQGLFGLHFGGQNAIADCEAGTL